MCALHTHGAHMHLSTCGRNYGCNGARRAERTRSDSPRRIDEPTCHGCCGFSTSQFCAHDPIIRGSMLFSLGLTTVVHCYRNRSATATPALYIKPGLPVSPTQQGALGDIFSGRHDPYISKAASLLKYDTSPPASAKTRGRF